MTELHSHSYVFFYLFVFILIGILSHFIIVLIYVSLMTEYVGHSSFIYWFLNLFENSFLSTFINFWLYYFLFLVFEFFILGMSLLVWWAEIYTHPVCFATQKHFKLVRSHFVFLRYWINLMYCTSIVPYMLTEHKYILH